MGEIRHLDHLRIRKAYGDLHSAAEEFCKSEGVDLATVRANRRDLVIVLRFPSEAHRRSIPDPLTRLATRIYRNPVRVSLIELYLVSGEATPENSGFQTYAEIRVTPVKKPSGFENEHLAILDHKRSKSLVYQDQFRAIITPEGSKWKNEYNSYLELNRGVELTPFKIRGGIILPEAIQALADLLTASQEKPISKIDPQDLLRHPSRQVGIQALAAMVERYLPNAKGIIKPPVRGIRVGEHFS